MAWAALIAWVVTAGGGFLLFTIWARHGGMQQREGTDRIRPTFLLPHFGLAASGLVLWLIYAFTDADALGWVAFVLLLGVAALGWTMFAIWLRQLRSRPGGGVEPAPAEQRFPRALVALHGVGATTTVLLVLLALIGVG